MLKILSLILVDLVPANLYLRKNVNLTFTINDQLLAGYSTNLLIIEYLKALNSAQRFFMKAELWAKLRNELRKQIRHTGEDFDLGQAVYYKRNNDIKSKSTGKIVGQNGSAVFIRHGGFHFKVHCSRIQIANSLFDTIPKDNNDSQLHFQPLSKDILHQMLILIVIQEMNSIQLIKKKLPLTIKLKAIIPNSFTSHIEVPTSDLPSQYQTSSSSPSSHYH